MKALIISNGSVEDYDFYRKEAEDADLIICADGGAHHARQLNLAPHVLLGDMDSISENDMSYYKEMRTCMVKLPAEKDETDTELAVKYAIEKGASKILLVGSTGTRLDHTLANISLLSQMAKQGIQGCILNEHNRIYYTNSKINLFRSENTRVSILPITLTAEGVTTKGLYYELKDATLFYDSTRGISNEFVSDEAEIKVRKGELLVILSKD